MSGIGDKIKDALHMDHPQSSEAARGEVSQDTPGSFPVDDMTGTQASQNDPSYSATGSEHNKLHKSSVPRGFTESGAATAGHTHTDSGVGLTTGPGGTTAQDSSYTHRRQEQGRDDTTALGTGTAAAVGSSGLASQQPGSTVPSQSNPPEERNIVGTGGTVGSSATEGNSAPYWGDIPQGTGVYNTVTGHGSHEDDAQRHQHIHAGETRTGTDPKVATRDPTTGATADPSQASQQRSFPIVSDGGATTTTDTTRNTTTRTAADTSASTEAQRSDDRSYLKEGVAGTAAAGAVGTGAYAYSQRQGDDRSAERTSETADSQSSGKKDNGKILGIFPHRSRDEKRETTEEKDSKSGGGLFHRSSGDKSDTTRQQDATTNEPPQTGEEGDFRYRAAQGYEGAAAFIDNRKGGELKNWDRPNPHSDAANQGQYEHLGSGTSSGIKKEDYSTSSTTRDTTTTTNPVTSTTDSRDQSHHYGTAAAGTAAGVGGGALAYHEYEKNKYDNSKSSCDPLGDAKTTGTTTSTRDTAPTTTSAATGRTDPRNTGAAGAGLAGVAGAGAVAGSGTRSNDPSQVSSTPATNPEADSANQGQYHHLASGTASGIAVGDETSTSRTADPRQPQTSGSGYGTAAAAGAGGAAAAGAAAAYASRKHDERSQENRSEKRTDPGAAAVASGVSGRRVVHTCTECGKDNDISHYFKQ